MTVRLADGMAGIGKAAWNALANPTGRPDPHPFTRFEFFEALEASGSASPRTGWQPAHLVLDESGATTGILPAYLKSHSQGEYVFDHAWADAFERAGGHYYPKLQVAVPFTPVTGPRLLAPTSELKALLLAGLRQLAGEAHRGGDDRKGEELRKRHGRSLDCNGRIRLPPLQAFVHKDGAIARVVNRQVAHD